MRPSCLPQSTLLAPRPARTEGETNLIAVVTSNSKGGIAQFAATLCASLRRAGVEVCEYVPHDSAFAVGEAQRLSPVRQTDVFAGRKPLRRCAKQVAEGGPDAVIFADTALVSVALALAIAKAVPTYIVIHDAQPHPTSSKSLKARLVQSKANRLMTSAVSAAQSLIFLSDNTRSLFYEERPCAVPSITIKLCAHPVDCEPTMPPELGPGDRGYALFFGRIDKYKGIETLLRVYSKGSGRLPRLVLAGSGRLSPEEERLLGECDNVRLINRFIGDAEMNWLFINSKVIVLPYIEASQSGVLPMAYHFGKPVVVSDLPGLVEFVDVGETGFVFSNEAGLETALSNVVAVDGWTEKVRAYERENLDWDTNIRKLLAKMEISGTAMADKDVGVGVSRDL